MVILKCTILDTALRWTSGSQTVEPVLTVVVLGLLQVVLWVICNLILIRDSFIHALLMHLS